MKKNFSRLVVPLCIGLLMLQHTNPYMKSTFDGDLGGFGNINVKTGDIELKNLIRDINILTFDVTSCENSVVSSCGSGSVCNVTIGPCSIRGSLNAAPSEIVFSRYLSQIDPYNITINQPNVAIPLIGLVQEHSYTTIIQCPFSARNVSYMLIALPTNPAQVDAITNLPLGLAKYLKRQKGTIIKVYRTTGTSSTWTEITEIKIETELNDKIIKRSNIINVEITKNGDLVLTYKNLKKQDGKIIPTTRVTYTSAR